MKKMLRNLLLALPLFFALQFAAPTEANARVIVPVRPVYVCGYQYVYGVSYQYVLVGYYWVLQPVYGYRYQYTCRWVY